MHQYSAILHQQFLSTSPRPANLLACNDRPLCGMVVVYYAAGTAVQARKGEIGIMAIKDLGQSPIQSAQILKACC